MGQRQDLFLAEIPRMALVELERRKTHGRRTPLAKGCTFWHQSANRRSAPWLALSRLSCPFANKTIQVSAFNS
ncbi:hypothetical protein Bpfe_005743 [Biomphalaria pfeifferi]|uniref:Uncharacterized protein n=1 Tax=Biomphalaria pfeifferi TaxID=112525 RepID=A0AAD8FIR9_BIOPF|nr:hypothetical protein Bpfe_005743 [Biomphalaria pfeifferi]